MSISQKIIERNRANAAKRFIDLSNKIFQRLTVLKRVFNENKNHQTMWLCRCECGKEKIINSRHLREGKIKSCGCLCNEINSKRMIGNKFGHKHGLTNHPLRAIRKSMIDRCYNPKNKFYKNYGERGIKVCDEWKESLLKFVDWALKNGWIKGLSIDRKQNNENYTPENCEWITISKNSSKNCVLGEYKKNKCKK